MTGVYLGEVILERFELPPKITFGGAQRVAVHKLIGGARVIDALGRDDVALTWSGTLSGAGAADRARVLDAMRVAGEVQTLSWDAFCYTVLIGLLRFEFCSPWWIPYTISCVVQDDLAQSAPAAPISPGQSIASDLAEAESLFAPDLSAVLGAASGLVTGGASGQGQALAMLTAARGQVSGLLQASASQLASDNILDIVSAAGTIASLACGAGYLDRSIANFNALGI